MNKWFKASNYASPKIVPVVVERETNGSVWVDGRRCLKTANGEVFRQEWEQARQWLADNAQAEVDLARRRLERANGALGNIKGMKKP